MSRSAILYPVFAMTTVRSDFIWQFPWLKLCRFTGSIRYAIVGMEAKHRLMEDLTGGKESLKISSLHARSGESGKSNGQDDGESQQGPNVCVCVYVNMAWALRIAIEG